MSAGASSSNRNSSRPATSRRRSTNCAQGIGARRARPGAARRHRLGQDLHDGACHRSAPQRPAIILAPNKTLAAQLYGEMKSFFPENAVEYFVSYYDYYQPEAYVPRTDTYVEKESSLNEQIDRMRHSATRAILERRDVVVVASVSCIYGIGSVETYSQMTVSLAKRRPDQPHPAARPACRAAIPAQRPQFLPRHVPGARRHDRDVPGALRGPRLAASRCSATRSRRSTRSTR